MDIRLLTNNPAKLQAASAPGIKLERVDHRKAYLTTFRIGLLPRQVVDDQLQSISTKHLLSEPWGGVIAAKQQLVSLIAERPNRVMLSLVHVAF